MSKITDRAAEIRSIVAKRCRRGSVAGGCVLFAKLDPGLAPTNVDFVVI
jgi:hypothetical protein